MKVAVFYNEKDLRIEQIEKPVTKKGEVLVKVIACGVCGTDVQFSLTSPNDTMSIKPFGIFKKEIVLKASFINPYTQKRALELIYNNKIDESSIVYGVEPLEKLPEILSSASLRAKGKFIINTQV